MAGLEGIIEQIKERLDIESVIGSQVSLKKSGRSLRGLCPFHLEKTPSFYVFPDKGNYHCFGCGANGDIFTYVMRTQNLSFGDALRQLAERAGVVLPERRAETAEDRALERLREACAAAAQFYHFQLRTEGGRVAREYVAKRGLNLATVEAFQLGYAPEGWDALLRYLAERGFDPEEVARAGLASPREGGGYYDRFRNRLLFPICDGKGRVVGFGARALDDSQPKYLNSPQTPLFDKGGSLYGLDRAAQAIRDAGYAVVVEGYVDVLYLHQCGINNVVASLGTALTERQVALLKRLTKRLLLALDADAAGEEATRRGLEVAMQVFGRKVVPVPTGQGRVRYEETVDADIRILRLPAGKDPDEVVRENPQVWPGLVAAAQPVVDFFFTLARERFDLQEPQGKSAAVRMLLPVLRSLVVNKELEAHYLQRLAQLVRGDERVLKSQLDQLPKATVGKSDAPASERARKRTPRGPDLSLEEHYLGLLLANLEQASAEVLVGPEEVSEPHVRQVLEAIWQAQAEGVYSKAVILGRLDPLLRSYCAELEGRMGALPPLAGDELVVACEEAGLRVQEEACRRALREYSYLIQEAEERKEMQRVADLTQRQIELNLRLDEISKLRAQKQAVRR